MFGLSKLQAALGLIGVLAILGFAAWVWRIDALRAQYRAALVEVVGVLEDVTGEGGISFGEASARIRDVAGERDHYRAELNSTRHALDRQSAAVRSLEEEAERLRALSEENRRIAEATIRERDGWIARFEEASTRAERLTAEEELQRCEEVLDALFEAGF